MLAQLKLGQLFQEQGGAEKALDWYSQAAVQGSKQASFELGKLYADSQLSVYNSSQAYFWLSRAVSNGYSEAQKLRGLVENKLSIEERYKVNKLLEAFSISN